jgi:hypothetical protein
MIMKIKIAVSISLTVLLPFLLRAEPGSSYQKHASNVPGVFIENKGQITDQNGIEREDIGFKTEIKGISVFIGKGQIHYQWNKSNAAMEQYDNAAINNKPNCQIQIPGSKIDAYRMDVTLVNASKNAEVIAEEKQDYYENYYQPLHKDGIIVNSYKKITYKNVYPGIDWVVYLNTGGLKYDFIVRPGGNPADIQVHYDGATSLALKDDGITANTPYGSITEQAPYSYISETKERVAAKFILSDNTLFFNIGKVEKNNTLVIDPLLNLNWATYYGGSGNDIAEVGFYNNSVAVYLGSFPAITTDKWGNVYYASSTQSSSNIATTGSFQSSFSANIDAYLVKVNDTGRRLWATYYGGSGTDGFAGIVCDASGNIYLAGSSSSSGLATSATYQSSFNGAIDGLFAKFDTSGQRLWASYYGGSDTDQIAGVSIDNSGSLYICGSTQSTSGITSSGSFQPNKSGSRNSGFVAKFNTAVQRQWATYYGNGLNSEGTDFLSIACDQSGNICVGGTTDDGGLASPGAFQQAAGAPPDGLLVKFSSSGNRVFATYYGTPYQDVVESVICDNWGNVYIGGGAYFTTSQQFNNMVTIGSMSFLFPGFIAKFNGSGSRIWGELLGGGYLGYGPSVKGLAFDAANNLLVTGKAQASNPSLSTTGAYQASVSGSVDGYFAKFDTSGSLLYGTYYGGTAADGFTGLAYNESAGKLYAGGFTQSTSGVTTANAFQTSFGGAFDGLIVCFGIDTVVYISQPFSDTVFCGGDSIHVNYGVNNSFNSGNIFTLQLSNASGSFTSPVSIGSITTQGGGVISGRIPATAVGTGYRVRIVSSSPVRTSMNDTVDIHIKQLPQNVTATSNTPVCAGDSLKFTSSTSTSGVSYLWSGQQSFLSNQQNPAIANSTTIMSGDYFDTVSLVGCKVIDTVTVLVKPLPNVPTAGSNSPLCTGTTLNLTAAGTSGATYSWTGPASFGYIAQNPSLVNVTTANGGKYIVTANLNGCTVKDSTAVIVYPVTPAPLAGSNSPVCVGGALNLTASTISGASYSWTGPSYGSNLQNPTKINMQTSNAGIYTVVANVNGCASAPATTNVVVNTGPSVAAYASPSSTRCVGQNVAVVAVPNNVSSPTYQWYLNSAAITGATNVSYIAPTVNNGDVFYVMMTAGTACNTPISSNSITITTMPTTPPPAANIVATPGTDVWPYLNVTFSISSLTNGGTTPGYQWKLNGVNVAGATKNTWNTTELKDGDSVCLWVTSSDQCATPKSTLSNCLGMKVPTEVGPLNPLRGDFAIYPNPVTKQLTIEGAAIGATIQVNNIIGQTIYMGTIQSARETINTSLWAPGGYLLHLTDKDGNRVVRKVVKE